ncbi:13646_t:CDS:2 [Entrophospora sp. SA101]|nr:13646_t:CDS:2 [Entrophospora sp. SA101]
MSPRIKQFEDSLEIIKKRFGKLQQDLVLKEDYIKYLEKEILIRNEKLDPLRQQFLILKYSSISNQISQMPSITPQSTITSTEIMKPESELQSNNSGITKTEIENIPVGTFQNVQKENMNRFLQCISGEIPEFIPVPPHSLHLKPQRYCSNCGRIGHNFRSSKQTTLEETIRKIIQSELKEILPSYIIQDLPFDIKNQLLFKIKL